MIRSLHLSDITKDSEDLMRVGEMGDLREGPVGPQDFPGIETHFEPLSFEQRKLKLEQARERLRLKQLLREKAPQSKNVFLEDFHRPDPGRQLAASAGVF